MISGSIGYDDWEWGVDLFAQDPLVFKKLIYEMRFDEASAKFAEFGPFYTGLQFAPGAARGVPRRAGSGACRAVTNVDRPVSELPRICDPSCVVLKHSARSTDFVTCALSPAS